MARPKKCRRITSNPEIVCFKPVGVPRRDLETEIIDHDEYEAFKLAAYDGLLQQEGAQRMEISRPTFTRLYNSAIQKIARAIMEGKAIEINFVQIPSENESKKYFMLSSGKNGT